MWVSELGFEVAEGSCRLGFPQTDRRYTLEIAAVITCIYIYTYMYVRINRIILIAINIASISIVVFFANVVVSILLSREHVASRHLELYVRSSCLIAELTPEAVPNRRAPEKTAVIRRITRVIAII